jgi:hypothetical protein
MMNSSRDEKFQGFANLLWGELINANGAGYIDVNTDFDDGIDPTDYRGIIARRAYDIVKHAIIELSCQGALDFRDPDFDKYEYRAGEMVEIIPDMTEYPQDQECSDQH